MSRSLIGIKKEATALKRVLRPTNYLPLAATLSLIPLVIAGAPRTANAQTWIDSTGNWSDGTKWNTGVPPVSSSTTALVFNANATAYTATNDIANPFDLNSLTFNDASSLGGRITIAGGTLNFTGTAPQINVNNSVLATISAPVTLSASTIIAGSGTGNLTFAGNVSATANTTSLLTFNNAGTVNFAAGTTLTSSARTNFGPTSDFANTSIALDNGVNNVTFQNGAKAVLQGALRVGVHGDFGAVSAGSQSTLTIQGTGAALPTSNSLYQIQSAGTLEVGDAESQNSNANGRLVLQNTASLLAANAFVGGEIGSTGVIDITGGSVLNISGAGNGGALNIGGYSGVGASGAGSPVRGTVNITNGNILVGGQTLLYSKGALNLGGTDAGQATSGGLNTAALVDGSDVTSAANAGAITMANNSIIVINGGGSSNSSVKYSGAITGTGIVNVRNAGSATFTQVFAGANTYTGTTEIGSSQTGFTGNAVLQAGAANAFSANSVASFQGANGTLDLNSLNQTVAGVQGTVGSVTLGSATLTVQGGSNSNFGGVISGTGGLTKTGTGAQTLSGTNTYTGTTAITGGALNVASGGSLVSSGTVALSNGGTLSGNGSVGNINLSSNGAAASGKIAPGTTNAFGDIGTLTATSLTWTANTGPTFTGGLLIDLNTNGTSDKLSLGTLTGNFSSSSDTFDVAFSSIGPASSLAGQTFTLASFSSTNLSAAQVQNQFRAYGSQGQANGTISTINGNFSLQNTGNGFNLLFNVTNATSTPEPGTFALLGVGIVPLAAVLRRRRLSQRN